MELTTVQLDIPDGANIIVGQAHFIKTVEDLFEIMVTIAPGAKFGIAFNEASKPCLIRTEGNDKKMIQAAEANARALNAGHVFNIVMQDCFPISVLNAVKQCQEVCRIFCATANPTQAVLARSEQGCGVLGVIDGFSPSGVEEAKDKEVRKNLLRKIIGYKK